MGCDLFDSIQTYRYVKLLSREVFFLAGATEQVVLLPNAAKSPSKEAAYEVIIIPTGATGASSIKREYPNILSFIWPEKKVDKEFGGVLVKDEKGTYVDVLKKVFNEQLESFNKSVINITENTDAKLLGVECVLSPQMGSNIESNIDGTVTEVFPHDSTNQRKRFRDADGCRFRSLPGPRCSLHL